jgi:hypothetical protein
VHLNGANLIETELPSSGMATRHHRTAQNPVGAAEGCDLLIFGIHDATKDQKIAAFGSSYIDSAQRIYNPPVRQILRPV